MPHQRTVQLLKQSISTENDMAIGPISVRTRHSPLVHQRSVLRDLRIGEAISIPKPAVMKDKEFFLFFFVNCLYQTEASAERLGSPHGSSRKSCLTSRREH